MSASLHITADNPAPAGAEAGLLSAHDGRRLRFATVPARGRARGTVVLLTGRNEAIEKYFETMADFAARGLATVALDWRGQGGSDRLLRDPMRGHVRSFDDYAADLLLLMREAVAPRCPPPFHLFAHSTGGLVALLAAPKLGGQVGRMMLGTPLLGLESLPMSQANLHRLSRLLTSLGFGSRYIGSRKSIRVEFAGNVLTSDPRRFARNMGLVAAFPHLGLGSPTAGWLRAACDAIATVSSPGYAERLRTPVLFVAAGDDRVVSTSAIARYAGRMPFASLVTIEGARHELPQEADRYRDQFLAAFDAFVPGEGG